MGIVIAVLVLIVKIRGTLLRREREAAGLPPPTDRFEAVPKSDKKVRYRCGHDGWKDYIGHFYGEEMEPMKGILKSRKKCPDCQVAEMKEVTRRCALCGLPIMPGSPVALYAGPASSFTKEWTTKVARYAMGCMRWDCCPSGGFFAGHWTGKEFRSAFDAGSAVAEVMASGQTITVSDLNDQSFISCDSGVGDGIGKDD